jgi:DNA repair exonuclease SbcCD ATPase subunit
MGACYVDQTFEASDVATLKNNFSTYAEQESFEHGHGGYSGTLSHGIRVIEKTFKDISEANDWVEQNCRKWEPALAVKVGDFNKSFHSTAKGSKAIAQVNELYKKLENFDKDLLNKIATQKSLFKTCNNCSSKISVKHFVKGNSTACPVCQKEFVKSAKDVEKKSSLFATWSTKQKELEVMKQEYNKKLGDKKPCWYVGGLAST